MESPFQPYFDTNYVPSESERAQIQHLLERPLQDVRDIDSEIAILRQQMEALTAKREERERYITQHRAILNPIRVLPEEILRTIFDHCIPERHPFPDRNRINFMSAGEAPLSLTFVCRRWRQVVLDYSSLWDAPYIALPLPLQDKGRWNAMIRKTAQLSSLWLSRSKDRPIELTMTSSSSSSYPTDGLNAIWEAVVAHSVRWKVLQLEVTNPLLDDILSLPSTAVPSLQRLGLTIFQRQTKDIPALFRTDNLIGGPSLCEISLRGSQLCHQDNTCFLALPVQWSQITNLDIPFIMLEDVDLLNLFGGIPAIQNGSFNVSQCRLHDPLPLTDHIALPNLTSLSLISQGRIANLLSSLHTPQLMRANLATDENGESLIALAHSSSGNLQAISLQSKIITPAEMIRFLTLTPKLRGLVIRYFPYRGPYVPLLTEELVTRLTPHPDQLTDSLLNFPSGAYEHEQDNGQAPMIICPKLQTIGLFIGTGPRVPDVVLLDFIRKRREMRPPTLRSVRISDFRHDAEMDIMAELQKEGVDTRGLDVVLQYREREPEGVSVLDL